MKDIYTEFYDIASKEVKDDLSVFTHNGAECIPTENAHAYSMRFDVIEFVSGYVEEWLDDYDFKFTLDNLFNLQERIMNAIEWGQINDSDWDSYRDITYDLMQLLK